MTKKERAIFCVEALKKEYTEALCSLNASNPLELLIATDFPLSVRTQE